MKTIYPIILAIFLFPKINFSQCPVLPGAMLADAGVGATFDFASAVTNSSGEVYDMSSSSTGLVSYTGSDQAASFATSGRLDFVNDNYDNNNDPGSANYCDFRASANSLLSRSQWTGLSSICGTAKHFQGYTFSAKFVSFDLVQKGPGVLAQWSVTQEHNSKNFEVQRSYNGNDWIVAGTVAATGEFDVLRNYSFLDDHVTKANVFYRIRHIDLDARHSSYTNIQSIKLLSPAEAVNIFTDSRKNIILNFYSSLNSKATIQVRSMYGEVFIEKATINPTTQVSIAADNLPAGIYIVSVTGNESLITAKKVILK